MKQTFLSLGLLASLFLVSACGMTSATSQTPVPGGDSGTTVVTPPSSTAQGRYDLPPLVDLNPGPPKGVSTGVGMGATF